METKWELYAERNEGDVPPAPGGWIHNNVVVWDPKRNVLVYVREPNHHGWGESWHLDADGEWVEDHAAITVSSGQFWTGHYDPVREAVVTWSIQPVHGKNFHYAIVGVAIDEDGVRPVETSGNDIPMNDDALSHDSRVLFAYDPTEQRTLAVTPYAIHELRDQQWQQVCELDETMPREWHASPACQAVWDHDGGRLLISLVDRDDYEGRVFAWTGGSSIRELPLTGLPGDVELYPTMKKSFFTLAASENHGTVMVLGAPYGTFRLEGETWTAIGDAEEACRRAFGARGAFDERDGSLWLGPAPYELTPGTFAKPQAIFCRLQGGRWETYGHVIQPSATDWYGGVELQGLDGELYIASRRYPAGLRTADDQGWTEHVSEDEHKDVLAALGVSDPGHVAAVAPDADQRLHAFTQRGAVLRWDSDAWVVVAEPDEKTFKEREDFLVQWDYQASRFVAWGGKVKNRSSNHTFYLEPDGWRKEKKTSAKPSDFRHKGNPHYVHPHLTWDPAEARLIRIGFDDVSVFQDGEWVPHVPQGYADACSVDAPLPVYDLETQELLLVDLYAHQIFRFGYDKVTKVADVVDHELAIDPLEQGTYAHVPKFVRHDLYAYDPARRQLLGQSSADESERFRLPLEEVFEAAAEIGERVGFEPAQVPESPAEERSGPVRLYMVEGSFKYWYGDVDGSDVRTEWGRLTGRAARQREGKLSTKLESRKSPEDAQAWLTKQAAKKVKSGYVTADELSFEPLLQGFASKTIGMKVGDSAPGKWEIQQIGGTPGGLAKSKWPKIGKEPLAHLCILGCSDELRKVAGVAVFVHPDDRATEEDTTHAVGLSYNRLMKDPVAAPKGVPVIDARSLVDVVHKTYEIKTAETSVYEADDPLFAAKMEELHAAHGTEETPWTKWGGAPQWVQGEEWPHDAAGEPYHFIGQLDFSELDTTVIEEAWPEATFWGVLYVFVSPDEKDAVAFWQYT